jgi:hypothetical protein
MKKDDILNDLSLMAFEFSGLIKACTAGLQIRLGLAWLGQLCDGEINGLNPN